MFKRNWIVYGGLILAAAGMGCGSGGSGSGGDDESVAVTFSNGGFTIEAASRP